jgi:hypothetical protein
MKIRQVLISVMAVLFAMLTLISCGGGGGGAPIPSQIGGGEGSASNPVDLGVANTTLTHAGSIGAWGSSYYKFTAGSSAGSHTISLTSTHSDLSWDLYNSSNVWIASCDSIYTAGDETCTTPQLTAGSVYYLSVDEWDTVAGSFTLTVYPPVNPTTPMANAGPDQNVKTGSKVTLNGSGSSDPNGDPLTYAWSFTQRPGGSAATLSSTVVTQPTFTADVDGTYIVRLVVNDGSANSLPDTVNITAATFNSTPTASAGVNQHVVAGVSSVVTLDGSASSDADGDPLIYTWTMTAKPGGSAAALSSSITVTTTFTADIEGTYTLSLVVNDGTVNSVPAIVTIKAYRKISGLGFRVIDAEYSNSLNKIIMVASTPSNQLHIYDPVTETDTAVNLNLVPTCVSVSPDGLYAAVGHNAWISYINLSTGTLVKTLSVTADVFDIVLAGNGYVYAFPRIDQWSEIHTVNISTGVETLGTSWAIYAGTRAKLHPGGTTIYGADNGLSPSDIEKYDISGGTATYLYDSPYHGDYYMCGDLWMSEDGLRIFTRCGNVFRSSPNRYSSGTTPEDMTYNGALQGLTLVKHLSHSQTIGMVAAVPENTYSSTTADTEVQIFNYEFLTFSSKVTLPSFVVSSASAYAGHGKYVFYNSSATKYFVVLQADNASAMLYDYGVVQY